MEAFYNRTLTTRILDEDYERLLSLAKFEGVRKTVMARMLLRKAIREALKEQQEAPQK